MRKLCRSLAVALFTGALFTTTAFADESLKMGDPAPALSVSKFVKGEPVKSFEKGKIYVVEFWATWCGPCRESIPHLTQMQKANTDVTFIGVDVGEDADKVNPFVEKMGDKMDYRVALDDLSKDGGATNAAYMTAAGQNGIPTAFLIDKDSNVAWIGHPMELEPVLKQVVAGTFDMKKAAAAAVTKAKLMKALQSNDLDGALQIADETIAADSTQATQLGMLEVQILLLGKKDADAAAKKADSLMSKIDDGEALNEMAWMIATAPTHSDDSLATALKLSEASLKSAPKGGKAEPTAKTSEDNAEYLDTLARIYAVKGDFTKAVELQTKAVDKCTNDQEKPELAKSLEAYKNKTLPVSEANGR